jgi:hypothetical protein
VREFSTRHRNGSNGHIERFGESRSGSKAADQLHPAPEPYIRSSSESGLNRPGLAGSDQIAYPTDGSAVAFVLPLPEGSWAGSHVAVPALDGPADRRHGDLVGDLDVSHSLSPCAAKSANSFGIIR